MYIFSSNVTQEHPDEELPEFILEKTCGHRSRLIAIPWIVSEVYRRAQRGCTEKITKEGTQAKDD
jgi:hypothetical protein